MIEQSLRRVIPQQYCISVPRSFASEQALNLLDWNAALELWTSSTDSSEQLLRDMAKAIVRNFRTYFEHGHIDPTSVSTGCAAGLLLFALLLHCWTVHMGSRLEIAALLRDSSAQDIIAVVSTAVRIPFKTANKISVPPFTRHLLPDTALQQRIDELKNSYVNARGLCTKLVEWMDDVTFDNVDLSADR